MAPTGDKLSPLFKSLRPDESHLQTAAAVAVQEAEQRWPLFRAIAPTRPVTTPELTGEERGHWSNPIGKSTAPQHKLALTVPGLNEQLAEGLSKMAGSKPGTRRASSRATPEQTVQTLAPAAKISRPESKKQGQEMPKVFKPLVTPIEGDKHSEPAPAPTAAPVSIASPAPAPILTPAPIVASTEKPLPAPARTATPVKKAASPGSVPTAPPPPPQKTPPATQRAAPPKAPKLTTTAKTKDPAANNPESLKSLFGRLEAPEKPPEKAAPKKSSFLGRLGKR